MKGYENIERMETQNTEQIEVGSGGTGSEKVTCTNRVLVYSAKDVPALKEENSVWCVKDFRSGIRFELSATKFPNDFYKPYSRTWNDLEETLKNETDFTSNIKTSNPYKDEILTLVSNIKDEKQKIGLVYNFIKEHIRWNGEYSFFGNNPKESVKKGTGNNAQINIILMSALKDAGIKSYPILMSRRSLGRLPYSYPSLNMLNTFIVGAETSDGNVLYLDGSSVYGGPNVLPTDLLVDRGYIFEPGHSEKWVDLTNISKNSQRSLLKANLDKDGILKGVFNILYSNQKALEYKTGFFAVKDSLEYIEKIQNTSQIKVDSLFIEGKEKISNNVKEKIVFNKQLDTNGDYIYINPLVFTHITKNNFTQTERKLPIEFNYPYTYSSICYITIPENYQIEELPKSQHILLNNNEGKFMYNITQNGNEIQLGYQFQINQTIFPFTDYPYIRDFYGLVATKNTEMIVLKKKQS